MQGALSPPRVGVSMPEACATAASEILLDFVVAGEKRE